MRYRPYLNTLWFVVMIGAASVAQSAPRFEVAGGYSYMDFHPDVPQLNSQSLNGGGIGIVYNPADWLGIKAEFMGYSFGSSWTRKLQELGYIGSASRNMFTYQFGPQLKRHSGKWQPYLVSLYGVAHSNGYGAVLRAKGSGTYILDSTGGNNTAFAMEIGGGLDIKVSRLVQLRPVELDYQLTRFGYRNFSANQSNFKYFAGINLTFGEK